MFHFVGQPVCFVMVSPQMVYASGPVPSQSSTSVGAAQQVQFVPCTEGQLDPCVQSAPPSQALDSIAVSPENVRDLASRAEGTRAVQRALEEASSDDERRELALQFKGHVWNAVMCPHANYVLQRCVTTLPAVEIQFIIDELSRRKDLCSLARHKFGCRLLQRLFEHCRQDQVDELGDVLISEAIPLSRHCYGNYVMQHLLTHGTDGHRSKFVSVLARSILQVASDMKALGVLNKAFEVCDAELRLILGRAVCNAKGLLVKISQKRRGHQVARLSLEALPSGSAELEDAYARVLSAREALAKNRFGRSVVKFCEREPSQLSDDDMSPMSDAELE